MGINVICAVDLDGGIGFKGELLFNIPNDLTRFREITTTNENNVSNYVVMGRTTWESLPKKPLKNRINVVLSRNNDYKIDSHLSKDTKIIVEHDLSKIINHYLSGSQTKELFIIGGAEIYAQAMQYADKVYLTVVHDKKESDTYFPMQELVNFEVVSREKFINEDLSYEYINYVKMEEK